MCIEKTTRHGLRSLPYFRSPKLLPVLLLAFWLTACQGPTPIPTPAAALTPMITLAPATPVLVIPSRNTPAPAPTSAVPRPTGPAPEPESRARAPGNWSSGSRQGIGTAFTYDAPISQTNPSRVWFTLDDGAVTDLFWPRIDQANFHSLRFLVSDGKTFVHDLWHDADIRTERPSPRLPFWRVTLTDKAQRYQLVEEAVAAPNADAILIKATFQALQGQPGDYQVYLYALPHLANSGQDDQIKLNLGEGVAVFSDSLNTSLASSPTFAVLTGDGPWVTASAGYVRNSDGLTDLADYRLDQAFDRAGDQGRPALTIWLPPVSPWLLALGFGGSESKARDEAARAIAQGWDANAQAYLDGWQRYLDSLTQPDDQAPDLFYLSAAVIKAHEDKTTRGAIIASSAVPWGDRTPDSADKGGYRRVWARDLYHAASGLLAAGDEVTPRQVLAFLDEAQQLADGSFPQNSYVDGRMYWTSTQLDEVAAPILLAWRLGAVERYASLVKPAAAYIAARGPTTPQERWEEIGGYSPATLAAQIAGLVAAADLAQKSGDDASAAAWLTLADTWQRQVKDWTFTSSGPLGDGRYFLRLAPRGDPNTDATLRIGGQVVDQRTLVDASFLELVRLGVLAPQDAGVIATLPEVDAALQVVTPKGPSWYRYPGDAYGEQDRTSLTLAQGRPWPLLTGERGVYAMAAGDETTAAALLQALEGFANEGGMFSEQVWEDTGEGTGSATPLVWTHAEYLVLWRSWHERAVFDLPDLVAQRYAR
ncbi:MAG: glycoside hydrolase family 15 protein [Anaerolineae bacterium]